MNSPIERPKVIIGVALMMLLITLDRKTKVVVIT